MTDTGRPLDHDGGSALAHGGNPKAAEREPFSASSSILEVSGDEIDLRELLRTLWRRKMVFIGTFVLVTAIAVLIVIQQTPLYTAKGLVMIDSRTTQVVDIEAVLSGLSSDAAAVQNQVQIIRSRALARRVVDRLGLADDPEFNAALRPEGGLSLSSVVSMAMDLLPEGWLRALRGGDESIPLSPAQEAERTQAGVIDAFNGKLTVSPVGFSSVIAISIESEDPQNAALIVNTVSEQYILDQLEAKFEATRQATEWLNDRTSDLRKQVQASERAVEAYRAKSGLVEGKGEMIGSQQLSELNSQVIAAQARGAEAEARLQQVQVLLGTKNGVESAAEVLQSPVIQSMRAQESEVLRKASELATRYGERHPKMINVRAEIVDLRTSIANEVRKIVQGLSNEVEVARAREQSLRASLKKLEARVVTENRSEVRLRQLQREADANRLLFQTFLSRFKETSEQQGIQQADARIISKAAVPLTPSYPKKGQTVGLAGFASLFLGALLVFLLERLDHGVRSPEQIERLTGVPALGMVPLIRGLAKRRQAAKYVLEKPSSGVAEAVRSLRTTLILCDVDQPPKVICISSSLPKEGKSTLALWLTRVAASSGEKVLLIDCDLRRPTIHSALEIGNEANLVDHLAGELSLVDTIVVDEASGAHVILAKGISGNPLGLLGSNNMKRLIATARERYDWVVLDTPPVLAVSDAKLLSQLADKTVFLAKWDTTPREALLAGLKQLTDIGADLAGVMLVQANMRKHARYGYGDIGYYYGHYREYYTD